MKRNILILTLTCLLSAILFAQKSDRHIPFRFGEVSLVEAEAVEMESLKEGKQYFFVKFSEKANKELLPVSNGYYLGNNTYILQSRADQLRWWAQDSTISGWALYTDEMKVHPALLNEGQPPVLEVILNASMTHEEIMDALQRRRIPVEKKHPNSHFTVIRNEEGVIETLKKMEEVVFIHPGGRKSVPEDLRSKRLHTSDQLDGQGDDNLGFDGEGVNVLVRDDGMIGPHLDFKGRLFNDPKLPFEVNRTHGDGVAGIIGAAGNVEKFGRGMAPGANIYAKNYESSFLDNTLDYHVDNDVLYTNSSYSNGCNDGYTPNAAEVDRQIYEYPTLLHIFSAGNSNGEDCGYGAGDQWGNITGGHKQSKNSIATANVNGSGNIMQSSSRGPATDGRLKPDIAANGNNNYSTDPNNNYDFFGGTSGAAPCVAGVAAQLCDAFRTMYSETPPSALLKAAMLNSANDVGEVGPDFVYGWGLLDAYGAYQILEQQQFFTAEISESENISYQLPVPPTVEKVKIMLYWPDAPGSPMAHKALVNDLDLTVDFNGNNYLPLVLDHRPSQFTLSDPAAPGIDTLNNMEQVVIEDIVDGMANINISGREVPSGLQRYYVVYEFVEPSAEFAWRSPRPGQIFRPNSTIDVQWENNITNVTPKTISFSLDGGDNWDQLLSFTPEDYYALRIDSAQNGDSVLIAVQEGAYSDTLEEVVYIGDEHFPDEISIDKVCAQDANISWRAKENASAYRIYVLGNKYIEMVAETTDTFATVQVDNPSKPQLIAIATRYNTFWTERSDGKIHSGGLKECPQVVELAADTVEVLNQVQLYYCEPFEMELSTRVSNFGIENVDSFELCIQLENNESICQWFDVNLIAGTDSTLILDSTLYVDSTAQEIKFWVKAPGDEYFYNDTLTENVNIVFLEEEHVIDSLIMKFSDSRLPALTRIINPDENTTWDWTFQTNKANERSQMLVIPNYYYEQTGAVDAFYTPIVDLDTFSEPHLAFDYAYSGIAGSPDELIVVAAQPCDITDVDTLWKGKGLEMATTNTGFEDLQPRSYSEWGEVLVSLEQYRGQRILIGFISINQWGNNIYLDDIAILPDSSYHHDFSILATPEDTACTDSTVVLISDIEGSGDFETKWYNPQVQSDTYGDTLIFSASDFFDEYVGFVSNQYYTTYEKFNLELFENPRVGPREIDRFGDTVVMRSRSLAADSVIWYGNNGVVLKGDTVTYVRMNGEATVHFEVVAIGKCTDATRSITIDFTTANDDAFSHGIKLFPNPSTGRQIHIEGLKGLPVHTLRFHDLQSRQVYSSKYSGSSDHLSVNWPVEFQPGVYLIELVDKQQRTIARLKVIRATEQ